MIKSGWIAFLASVLCVTVAHSMDTAPKKQHHFSHVCQRMALLKQEHESYKQAASKASEMYLKDNFTDDAQLFITYEPDEISLEDKDSLELRWAMSMAESVAQARLQKTLKEKFSFFDVYTESKHFAPSFLSVQIGCLLENEAETVGYLESEIERVQSEKVSKEEFLAARSQYASFFEGLLKENKSEEQQAAYDDLRIEYEEEHSFLPFQEFLQNSYGYLKSITQDEVSSALFMYFDSQNRVLESFSLNDFENQEAVVLDCLGKGSADDCELYASSSEMTKEKGSGFSALKRGFADHATESFHQLRLNETDKKLIKKLVTTMADKNVFQLLLDKKSLEKKGKQIRPVHPMRFLGYICSDGHMRKCLHSISKNHFKWSSFVDGFKDRMKEEAKRGQLHPYVPGFSQLLNVDQNIITDYINRSDYEGLMKYFI